MRQNCDQYPTRQRQEPGHWCLGEQLVVPAPWIAVSGAVKMRHGYGRGQTYACCEAASESQGCGSEMRDAKRRSLEEASN